MHGPLNVNADLGYFDNNSAVFEESGNIKRGTGVEKVMRKR
jgi:hypothetical protein